jgi:general secretion pathway protein G
VTGKFTAPPAKRGANMADGMQRSMMRNRSENGKSKSQLESGFSLLELMIAMFILIILLSVALPTYQSSVQQARETVLQENLWQIRRSIDQYGTDKGRLPQSLDDLVTAGYLREKPKDPITETTEWTEIQGESNLSADGETGLKDVKSTAQGEDSNGKPFADY